MRAALFALLVAATAAVGCVYSFDDRPFQACKVSETATVCLEAESHSDFAWLQANMFSTNCSGDDCHGAKANGQPPGGKMILAEGFAYEALMGAPAGQTPPLVRAKLDAGHLLVSPGNPDVSYLLFMLAGLPRDNGEVRFQFDAEIGYMPQSNKTLCCQKLDAVRRWIEAGAKP